MSASTAPWCGAHACATGAANSNAVAEALGRSRGGFSCKIHALTDALGLPVRFILTGGQAADIAQAIPLMKDIGTTDALLADKGYDADTLLDWLGPREITAVIPPKANRKVQRSCDWYMYKERHVIECVFGKLKYFHRIATRYEKKSQSFYGNAGLCCRFVVVALIRQQSLGARQRAHFKLYLCHALQFCAGAKNAVHPRHRHAYQCETELFTNVVADFVAGFILGKEYLNSQFRAVVNA